MVTSSFTSSINPDLPNVFLPNPVVNSMEYRHLNDRVQVTNNVHTGPHVWCQSDKPLQTSLNQQLNGLPNPKTLVEPVIMPPIFDNDYWRANSFMIPRNINRQARQELSQNGYMVTTTFENQNDDDDDMTTAREDFRSFDQTNQFLSPREQERCVTTTTSTPQPFFQTHAAPSPSPVYENLRSGTGGVETPYGYHAAYPEKYHLPVNYVPQYASQLDPNSRAYNENIFTSTLQPSVYSRSQVVQPDSVMSNLGISYTQPFLPTYPQSTSNGGVLFTETDPSLMNSNSVSGSKSCKDPGSIPESDVYDPRLTGYGASNRYYLDEITGRPMYMYDDVDLIRQNNFITRNALDFTDFGLQTGPQPNTRDQKSNTEIRELAQKTFMDNTLSFRTELQERLMKKNSNREWQQKQSPIVRNQYTRGASSAPSGSGTSYRGPRN